MELREFQKNDTKQLVAIANSPEVAKYLRDVFPSPYTKNDAEWWINEGCKLEKTFYLAIDIDGKCVGSIGVNLLTAEHRYTAELGYWLGRSYWGKGIAPKAVNIFTDIVFNKLTINRIFAPVAHENVASISVLKKCKFECEGILRKNMCLRGKIYDEYIYAKYS